MCSFFCPFKQPVKLMECFLRVAEANTSKNLETCGILGGSLVRVVNGKELFSQKNLYQNIFLLCSFFYLHFL